MSRGSLHSNLNVANDQKLKSHSNWSDSYIGLRAGGGGRLPGFLYQLPSYVLHDQVISLSQIFCLFVCFLKCG